ncbi:S49 family peptidase [Chondrinema litorale]|uniref:S49 family peptidase n=1 Tax=Chondrinema litorale TaxID=2994555 RepID=UPI002543A976|nr:S49 family peptidase [Chondrinema litorale]UZR95946.1 S49 family peptidase [Chondrinema litorale]
MEFNFLNQQWLISKEGFTSLLPVIATYIQSGKVPAETKEFNFEMAVPSNSVFPNWEGFKEEVPAGSIAIIPIIGVMFKYRGYGGISDEKIITWISQAERNPNISAVIFLFDTPGGTVFGTQLLANAVNAMSKPKIAMVYDGMCCSKGYWIASQCDRIIASSEQDIIGSIGTMLSITDYSKYFENAGIKIHEILADKSKNKNSEFDEAMKGRYTAVKDVLINPVAETFHNAILSKRPNVPGKVLTGLIYTAKEALEYNLIDEIGSLDMAIESLSTNSNLNVTMAFSLKNWFSSDSDDKNLEEEVKVKSKELTELKASMKESVEEHNKLTNQVKELTAKVSDVDFQLAAVTKERDDLIKDRDQWKTKAESYGEQPGDTRSSTKKEGNQDEDNENQKVIDSLPHNRAADAALGY